MKRWMTHLGIGAYLMALAFGFVTHAVDFGTGCHPIMYFLIWDMFCGWSSYEGRMHVISEGESGKFYELAPGPWGEFHPYGFIDRHHYDPNQNQRIRHCQELPEAHEARANGAGLRRRRGISEEIQHSRRSVRGVLRQAEGSSPLLPDALHHDARGRGHEPAADVVRLVRVA